MISGMSSGSAVPMRKFSGRASDCTMEGGSLTVNHGTVGITSGGVSVDGGGGIDMTAGIIKLN